MPQAKVFLIDAHALCYRSYFAIKELVASNGQATNAVYGFTATLRKILRDDKPEYMAVCFDVGKKTRRQERYSEYKIHRPSMPDDLIGQIPIIKEVVLAYHLPVFELEGFEADDIIATIASRLAKDDVEVVIVSGDKDMMQLLSDRVKILNIREEKVLGVEEARQALGIDPRRISDFLGLAGDQADNIPGVQGIGEVTARDLINQFGTVENVLNHLDQVKSQKVREKLQEQKEIALLSKELAILDSQVPIKFDLKSLRVLEPNYQRLFEVFKRLEFRKWTEEIAPHIKEDRKVLAKTIHAKPDLQTLIGRIQKKGEFSFLLENPQQGEGFLFENLAISVGKNEVYIISADQFKGLKDVFEDRRIVKVTHDVKEGMKLLWKNDIAIKGQIFDVMLAGYLIAPSQTSFDLESLAWNYLKAALSANDGLESRVDLINGLFILLKKELTEKDLLKLFEEIEIPLAFVLAEMEKEGVLIDEKILEVLSVRCTKKIGTLAKELYRMAGMEFNLNSPKQLSHVLFEKLKLPVIKKTKTGLSTDESVLTKLAETHKLPELILEYRQLAKLKSTYIDALPRLVSLTTGRLHASFNQAGTETGRLSSNNPNLQNIPIRTELGRQIRKAFIARNNNYLIVSADYSQIELRILAHMSGDENLIKAFKEGQDIHTFTAGLIFDVPQKDVTSEMRNRAKRVNFGIIYGISAFGLSKDLGVSQKEAQEFIDRYFLRYSKVKTFMDSQIKKAEEQGYVLTLMNRRRYLPEIKNANNNIRQLAQRQAINTPVQGSAADLMKLAMIHIDAELKKKKLNSKMIITVHDELVFDVLKDEKEQMIDLIRDHMEHPLKLKVPITVSVKAGFNWLDLKVV